MSGAGVFDEGFAEVFVDDWLDLRRLPLVMDDVGDQVAAIVRHATQWVAGRQGFEPSPVCLLRPLAEAMDLVSWAFEGVGRAFAEEWAEVRDGVVAAELGLAASDDGAWAAATALTRAVD